MSLFKIATEMMQYVGFGLAAASTERLAEAENPSIMDTAPFICGMILWAGGLCSEFFSAEQPVHNSDLANAHRNKIIKIANDRKQGTSHAMLTRALRCSAGAGVSKVVLDLVHNEADLTDSVSVGAMAFTAAIAAVELSEALYMPRRVVKPFSIIRNCVGLVKNLFLVNFCENYLRDKMLPGDFMFLSFALGLLLCESFVSAKNDKFIWGPSVARRELMKFTLVAGPINTLIDFLLGKYDAHTVTANSYLLLNNLMVMMTFYTLDKIERNNSRPFPDSLVTRAMIKKFFDKNFLSFFELPVYKTFHVYDERTRSMKEYVDPDYEDEFTNLPTYSDNEYRLQAQYRARRDASLEMSIPINSADPDDRFDYQALDLTDEKSNPSSDDDSKSDIRGSIYITRPQRSPDLRDEKSNHPSDDESKDEINSSLSITRSQR